MIAHLTSHPHSQSRSSSTDPQPALIPKERGPVSPHRKIKPLMQTYPTLIYPSTLSPPKLKRTPSETVDPFSYTLKVSSSPQHTISETNSYAENTQTSTTKHFLFLITE